MLIVVVEESRPSDSKRGILFDCIGLSGALSDRQQCWGAEGRAGAAAFQN